MRKRLPLIFSAAALILALLTFLMVCSLRQTLNRQSQAIQSQIIAMRQETESVVYGITGQVQEALEQQSSILASVDIQTGDPDYRENQIPYVYTIVPKESSPDTSARLISGNEQYPMTRREDGSFIAEVKLPLLSQLSDLRVVFSDGDTSRTEEVPSLGSYAANLFLIPQVNLSGTIPVRTERYVMSNGSLEVTNSASGNGIGVTSLAVVADWDGKEIDRITYPEAAGPDLSEFVTNIDLDYPLHPGSVLTIYVEIIDTNGIRYLLTAEQCNIDQNGKRTSALLTLDTDILDRLELYGPQGNLLWRGDTYELY
jgi:hypothetical protein